MPEHKSPRITQRQGQILAAIVREYSRNGRPIGSQELADAYNFAVSPATIRNEMQILEKRGFITHPHTSAGRIPTDRGYRYFVNKLMRHLELSNQEQQRLQRQLLELRKQYLELGQSLTKLLAEKSCSAAFAMLPASRSGEPASVSVAGFPNVVEEGVEASEIRQVAQFLDDLSEHRQEFMDKTGRQIQTYIGSEAPVPISENFSMVVTKVNLPGGERGVVGVVGPKRMKYAKNISLLEYIKKLLSSGLGAYIIISTLINHV